DPDGRQCDGERGPGTRGWTGRGPPVLGAVVERRVQAGLHYRSCTDAARDGRLAGPSSGLYGQLRAWAPGLALQASGGARDVADVRAAKAAGCAGIVLGRALLEGRISLAEALAC